MLILHDPDTLLHETVELLAAKVVPALESPARIKVILEALSKSDHEVKSLSASASDEETVLDLAGLTHSPQYLQHYRTVHQEWVSAGIISESDSVLPECFSFPTKARSTPPLPKDIYARSGYYAFDMSSGVTSHTWRSVIASANLAVQAVHLSTLHRSTIVGLCRPPGHHCDGHKAGGYCYINNAALAVDTFRRHNPSRRVVILDLDFHHGNGTQEIFWNDAGVLYVSIHGQDEFPYYTGYADEVGSPSSFTPDGRATNVNLPLATRSKFDPAYLEQLDVALAAVKSFEPAFLVVSLGFDTFHLDPLGNFQIYTEDYETMARTVWERLPKELLAVILLEGGYAMEHLGENFLSFLKGLEGNEG